MEFMFLYSTDLWKRLVRSQIPLRPFSTNCESLRMPCNNCCAPNLLLKLTWPSRTTPSSLTVKSVWLCARPSPCHHASSLANIFGHFLLLSMTVSLTFQLTLELATLSLYFVILTKLFCKVYCFMRLLILKKNQ